MIGHLYTLLLAPTGAVVPPPVATADPSVGALLSGIRPRRKVVKGYLLPTAKMLEPADPQQPRLLRQRRQLRTLLMLRVL